MSFPAVFEKWAQLLILPLKKILLTAVFFFFYLILPVYLRIASGSSSFTPLTLFYISNSLILLLLFKKNSDRKYQLAYQAQKCEEELNILKEENLREFENNVALQTKIIRYNRLKKIVEEINENLDLDLVADGLADFAFSHIANNKGACTLYLVDNQTQELRLFKTKKNDKELVIKAKQGDIFDHWVLRQAIPLMIEDTKKDFRFDMEKLKRQDVRPVSSLIISPFVTKNKFLGILRLDNPRPNFYSQDDLRFLASICDLGAMALENSELFQQTQDLAIHDGLTCLYTKGYFFKRLKEESKRASRQNTVFSLLMLDIDHFKNYNDKFGHAAGDIVLKKISDILAESFKKPGAIISRFGGEEFCIILLDKNKKEAYSLASMLRKNIENQKIILRWNKTSVTVSIGIAAFPEDSADEEELISKADKAMYEAKNKGRNRVCCI